MVHGRCGITAPVAAVATSCQECQDHVRSRVAQGSVLVGLVGLVGFLPRCCSCFQPSRQMLVSKSGSQPRGFPISALSRTITAAHHVKLERTILHPILVCSVGALLDGYGHANTLPVRVTKAASDMNFSVCCAT